MMKLIFVCNIWTDVRNLKVLATLLCIYFLRSKKTQTFPRMYNIRKFRSIKKMTKLLVDI